MPIGWSQKTYLTFCKETDTNCWVIQNYSNYGHFTTYIKKKCNT